MMSGTPPNKVPAPYSTVSFNSGVGNNNGRLISNFDFYGKREMILVFRKKERNTDQISWDHTTKEINELLGLKYHKVIRDNRYAIYDSLIGQISFVIGNLLVSPENQGCYLPNGHDEERFYFAISPKHDDITVSSAGKYVNIIEEMKKAGIASKKTAIQILECISKPCKKDAPKDLSGLGPKIFEGIDDLKNGEINPAKKLIAVLICEAIRFKDNGASVRMAIRKVIDLYNNTALEENDPKPFEKVFIGNGKDIDPIAVFALGGGREIMDHQILGSKSIVSAHGLQNFEKYLKDINKAKDNISDDDDDDDNEEKNAYMESCDDDNYKKNQDDNEYTSKNPKRAASDRTKGSLNEDVLAAKFSPERNRKTCSSKNFSLSFTKNNNDNYRDKEAQHDFDENQTHTSDHEEHNNFMGASPTVNNDFRGLEQKNNPSFAAGNYGENYSTLSTPFNHPGSFFQMRSNVTLEPRGEHFCTNCNLLYAEAYDLPDATILNKCPICGSSENVIMIPYEEAADIVLEAWYGNVWKRVCFFDDNSMIDGWQKKD